MRVQFGDFIVDDDARLLLRAGGVVHVSPKAFDLLAELIRQRPRAISKADLQRQLWPKTFVSDASLVMLATEIRAALGESARQPRFVRTVHRHGYAFQGTVTETETSVSADAGLGDGELAMGYWLVSQSREVQLGPGDNIVGRDPKARVWLDSQSVSRRHARIRVHAGRVTLEDLGSKNGTRAHGARLTAVTPLEDGDQLRFGSVGLTFRASAADPTRSDSDPL